jgi:hypothetical protein
MKIVQQVGFSAYRTMILPRVCSSLKLCKKHGIMAKFDCGCRIAYGTMIYLAGK